MSDKNKDSKKKNDESIHYLKDDPNTISDDSFFSTEYKIFSQKLPTGPDVTKEFLETIEKENKNNKGKGGKRKYRSNKKKNSKKTRRYKKTKKNKRSKPLHI
jgi:hypothetical protein